VKYSLEQKETTRTFSVVGVVEMFVQVKVGEDIRVLKEEENGEGN